MIAAVVLAAACAIALSGCGKDITLGKQCPAPASGRAEVRGGLSGYGAYGVTCAPCDDDDTADFDDDGCPIFVTFESCGGDICIGRTLVRKPPDPPDDAGADEDGGEPSDDAAAEPGADAGGDAGDEEDGGA